MARRILQMLLVTVLALAMAGCIFGDDDGKKKDGAKSYQSFGSWPEYSGGWRSLTGAAGSKFATWAWLDIDIDEDGTFSGTYRSFGYDYTYYMSTHIGDIPVQVYNPTGTSRAVSGAIDFDNASGIASFAGKGETTFSLNIISTDEIAMVFPSGFAYTVANVDRR